MMASEKLIGNVRVYSDCWVLERFCETSDNNISKIFFSLATKETHLALNADLFRK